MAHCNNAPESKLRKGPMNRDTGADRVKFSLYPLTGSLEKPMGSQTA